VPESLKRERQERLYELQRAVTAEQYERFLGRDTSVLVQRVDADGYVEARAPWQADDVDGVVHVHVPVAIARSLAVGSFLDVHVDDVVDDYDFAATFTALGAKPRRAPSALRRAGRMLPVTHLPTTVGSFGR
jgi:ribosomal protein S12 methylthiotransferase